MNIEKEQFLSASTEPLVEASKVGISYFGSVPFASHKSKCAFKHVGILIRRILVTGRGFMFVHQ